MVNSTYVGGGQYGVVKVGNVDVVRLGNSKVAASWIRICFWDEKIEHVAWICGFEIPALSILFAPQYF
jgi:hypothetical protein